MPLEEATKRIEELEAELKRVNEHREEMRRLAKWYMGHAKRMNYEIYRLEIKHEKATAIIAEMGGY
jgi:predicted  nucleic acid-binding Zn-ribbon protein